MERGHLGDVTKMAFGRGLSNMTKAFLQLLCRHAHVLVRR